MTSFVILSCMLRTQKISRTLKVATQGRRRLAPNVTYLYFTKTSGRTLPLYRLSPSCHQSVYGHISALNQTKLSNRLTTDTDSRSKR